MQLYSMACMFFLQISGFHQSIAHSFVTLEAEFHFNDIITASVTCKRLVHVIYQLSSTACGLLSACNI